MTRTNVYSASPAVPSVRPQAPAPFAPPSRPPVEVPVPSSPIAVGSTADAVADVEAGLGLAFARGAVVGAVLVFLVCGGISLVAGASVVAAVGIGAFAAFWGGPGFGGMMGAVLHYSRHHPDH